LTFSDILREGVLKSEKKLAECILLVKDSCNTDLKEYESSSVPRHRVAIAVNSVIYSSFDLFHPFRNFSYMINK
jgi:hypothetical protein